MYAYLGTLNLSFKEYLYLEATARQEYTSTLPPGKNDYFYPSVNAGFIFSDAFELPKFISFGKLARVASTNRDTVRSLMLLIYRVQSANAANHRWTCYPTQCSQQLW